MLNQVINRTQDLINKKKVELEQLQLELHGLELKLKEQQRLAASVREAEQVLVEATQAALDSNFFDADELLNEVVSNVKEAIVNPVAKPAVVTRVIPTMHNTKPINNVAAPESVSKPSLEAKRVDTPVVAEASLLAPIKTLKDDKEFQQTLNKDLVATNNRVKELQIKLDQGLISKQEGELGFIEELGRLVALTDKIDAKSKALKASQGLK